MGILFAIVACVLLGVGYVTFNESTKALGPWNTTLFYYLFGPFFAFVIWVSFGDRQAIVKSALVWPALTALFITVSVLFFTLALKHSRVSVASTIYSLSFVLTIALAFFLKKDVLHAKDLIASGLAVAAVIVFAI